MAAWAAFPPAIGKWMRRIQRQHRRGRVAKRSLRRWSACAEPLEPRVLLSAAPGLEDVAVVVGPIVVQEDPVTPPAMGADENGFVVQPYLQNVDTDGIVVMWEKTDNRPMTVEYGVDATYGHAVSAIPTPSGYQGTYIYKAEISSLAAETTYHFRVLDDVGTPVTTERRFTTFTTNEIDFSFSMWGDSQGTNHGVWSADPDSPTSAMLDHMVTQGVDFGFSVGDLAESGASYSDTHRFYLDRVAEHLGQTVPWFNAWGNHDGGANTVIRKFADMPSKDRGAPYTAGYGSFAFEQAGVLFVAIDYASSSDVTNGWLEGVLQAHPNARFTVLGIHVPPYCERWIDGSSSLRANLVPLAEQYGVDVIVSGHTHEYERGFQNGIYYVITGGGSWLDFPEPIVHQWDLITVGGTHDLPGEWAKEITPGVLGAPEPIRGGLVNEYVEFLVYGETLEARMHAFNADGSYIGVLDTFIVGQLPGLVGDVNQDGIVSGDGTSPAETDDLSAFSLHWKERDSFDTQNPADINRDGVVDLYDFSLLREALHEAAVNGIAAVETVADSLPAEDRLAPSIDPAVPLGSQVERGPASAATTGLRPNHRLVEVAQRRASARRSERPVHHRVERLAERSQPLRREATVDAADHLRQRLRSHAAERVGVADAQ